jgi:hypothetical protein
MKHGKVEEKKNENKQKVTNLETWTHENHNK